MQFSIFGSGRGYDVFSSYLKWNRNSWESQANSKLARLNGSDETKKKKAPNQWLMNNGTQTKMRFSEECDLMQPVVR